MKMRNEVWIAMAMLVVLGLPASADEAVQEIASTAVCSVAAPTVEAVDPVDPVDPEDGVEALIPLFQAVGQCNCTLGSPCSIPCPSATQAPVCVNLPCVSTNALINGVCKCV